MTIQGVFGNIFDQTDRESRVLYARIDHVFPKRIVGVVVFTKVWGSIRYIEILTMIIGSKDNFNQSINQ